MSPIERRAALASVRPAEVTRGTRLLTPREVAEQRLSVTTEMVYKLIRTGQLPAVYVGRLPRIDEEDLAAYIERARARGGRK